MYQGKLYDDDGGNRVICVGEDVDRVKAEVSAYHLAEYEEVLTWTLHGEDWVTPYAYGMQYAVEPVSVV